MICMLAPMTSFAAGDPAFEVIDTNGNATQYTDVQTARKAMKDGYTLKLLKDYVSTPDYNFGISLEQRDITVDLNGYSITSNKKDGYALQLKQKYGSARNNTVTIKNSGSKQSVLRSSGYQLITASGNSSYTQMVKLEGDIVFASLDNAVAPLGINLGTGSSLLDTETARRLVPNGGFSAKASDGNSYIYGSLGNAATASADGTVTLLHDYNGNEVLFSGSKNVILDMNGHTYTYTGSNAPIDVNHPNVTLTVKNGKVTAANAAADGALLVGAPYATHMHNRGLILDNVELTVTGEGKYGIVTNGTEKGNRVTLKNSVLNVTKGVGIYFPSDGDVVIDSSVINAKETGVQICSGNLTIKGDTSISVTGQPQAKTDGDGSIADGAAVSIVNREGYQNLGTVSIEDGMFNSAAGIAPVKAYAFSNANKTEDVWTEAGNVVAVSGGNFSSDIAEDIIDSALLASVTNGNETRIVVGKPALEAMIRVLNPGDKITFKKAADQTSITLPEGIIVTNDTGNDLTINGSKVETGDTSTATHVWDTKYTVDKEPTCTEDGIKSIHCLTPGCTERKDIQVIPKLGHSYADGKCTVCGAADPDYAGKDVSSSQSEASSPKTDDSTNFVLLLTIILTIAAALTGVFYSKNKKYHF